MSKHLQTPQIIGEFFYAINRNEKIILVYYACIAFFVIFENKLNRCRKPKPNKRTDSAIFTTNNVGTIAKKSNKNCL
jgi:hypothetical protein